MTKQLVSAVTHTVRAKMYQQLVLKYLNQISRYLNQCNNMIYSILATMMILSSKSFEMAASATRVIDRQKEVDEI